MTPPIGLGTVSHVFAIAVRFDLPDAEAAEAFDRLVEAAVPGILSEEPGTLVYTPHVVMGEPLARLFYEVYRDEDAHRAHEARSATADFLRRVRALVSEVRVDRLAPAGREPKPGRVTAVAPDTSRDA